MRKISQILKVIRDGVITEVPAEYQACESCREITCDSAKAEVCEQRIIGERQEKKKRIRKEA